MAEKSAAILLVLRPDNPKGNRLFGERWPDFVRVLQTLLSKDSDRDPEISNGLLRFHFADPAAALDSLTGNLRRLKEKVAWDEILGPVPILMVLHLLPPPPENEQAPATATALPSLLQRADDPGWQGREAEIPYLTAALQERWPKLADPQKLGHYHLGDQQNGLFPLRLELAAGNNQPSLFPHRHLPRQGKLRPCFYCGMTFHEPAACPAKMLNMQTQGLPLLGYLPLAEIGEQFKEAMARREELNQLLAAGISPTQLRKDHLLRTYVSYFDLTKVFQPRFLIGIAFTAHSRWEQLGQPEAARSDNSNLFIGLDCLRVGQYRQADEQFISEGRRPKGKAIYATIGRALVALEQKRHHEMGHYLENALKLAITDKDRIYICLLLYRYYRMMGDEWKATQALDNIITFSRDCPEALYHQVLLGIAGGFAGQTVGRLRTLVADHRHYFFHALLDPELLPIQPTVEEILRTRLQSQEQAAGENLAQARVTCQEMIQWLPENDEELKSLEADLAIIEQQEERKSYFDLIDIAEKSRLLVSRSHRIQEAKIDALYERMEQTSKRMEGFQSFWRNYQYQSFFPNYGEILGKIEQAVTKAGQEGSKNMHGALYRSLIENLDQCDQEFTTLKDLTAKMVWVRTLFNAGRQFVKSLIVLEMILVSLTVALLVSLIFMAGDSASGLAQLSREPALQKRIIMLVTLVLAPAAAMIHTLWRLMEK